MPKKRAPPKKPAAPVTGTAAGGPQSLAGYVAYQTGAVVSREVLRKETGTVTLFAFDQGQGLSEHTAPFDVLAAVVDGAAQITIAGNPHRVKVGEFILMPANQPHAVQAIARFKMLLVMIRK